MLIIAHKKGVITMDKVKNIYGLPTMRPIDISRVLNNLPKVIIDNKSYEVSPVEGYKFVFITGYNEDERDLQPWDHPLIVEGVRTEKIIVTDVRKYLRKVDEQPVLMMNVVKDRSGLLFMVNRTILMALIDAGNLGLFKQVQNSTAAIFGNVIATHVSMFIDINPREKLLIETVAAMYVHNMFLVNYSDDERNSVIKARVLNTRLSLPSFNKKEIDDIALTINNNPKTFGDLVSNIGNVVTGKKELFKEEAMYASLNSLWYGPGNVSTGLAHLEDLSTMISLYYTAITDPTYKRTRVATIIENMKRRIDVKSYEMLGLIIKEYQDM